MAKVTCSISGLELHIPNIAMTLPYTAGYSHPVFHLPHKHILTLYKKHCSGSLSATDSYLTLLAILNNTGQVKWRVPCTLDPTEASTIRLVEANIKQLVEVIEVTNAITLPSFKQPSFVVTLDTCRMERLHSWIEAWKNNIEAFKLGRSYARKRESIQAVENKLSYLIRSGIPEEQYAHVIANWAAKAGDFPKQELEEWTKVIRSCFSSNKMFSTSLDTLKEIKAYCEANIEVGSVHFHVLMETLKGGIGRHNDYLGLGTGGLGYTLLDIDTSANDIELARIGASAPTAAPRKVDYPDTLSYTKARLAWLVASTKKEEPIMTPEGEI